MDLGKLEELSERRVCTECGVVFLAGEGLTAMQKFADHSARHGFTPAQWKIAHELIQAGKEKEKLRERQR